MVKDKEEALQDEIADLKQKMKEDKNKEKPSTPRKEDSKKDDKKKASFDFHRVLKASLPFIIIIIFIVGFFLGTTFEKNYGSKKTTTSTDTTDNNPAETTSVTPPKNTATGPLNINECSDTDNGLNPYAKGEVFFNNAIFYDSCTSNTSLTEYSCSEDNNVLSKTFFCELCDDGTCLLFQNRTYGCKETDNYVDFNTKGYVMDQRGKIYVDTCSQTTIEEWYCDAYGTPSKKSKLCDKCEDGACVPVTKPPVGCKDTDNGIDYYVKGTATEISGRTATDNCQGRTLEEAYCSPQGYVEKTYKLCNQCVDGACIKTDVTQ